MTLLRLTAYLLPFCFISSAGTNYKDDSFNLMPFFTASCYSGYGDDAKVCLHRLAETWFYI